MRGAALLLLLLAPAAAGAAEALVVLSEPAAQSYREALDGLRAEWPGTIETASADRPLPPGPHGVIIAFGGRAAARALKDGAPVVAALAPAHRADAPGLVRVAMTPSPERFVSFLAAAGVHRLLAVRAIPAEPEFTRRAAEAGKRLGVAVDDQFLLEPEDLPRLLRVAGGSADAVWLAPDPGAVTRETFGVAREFARARGAQFFAPASGLVADGIRGELTVSFFDCGREAARAARQLLAGRRVPKVVYPAPSERETPVSLSTVSASIP